MTNKYSSLVIGTVKTIMEEDQYKNLMGPPLKKEIIKQVDKFTNALPIEFDQNDKDFYVKKILINLRKTMKDGNFLIDRSTFTQWYKKRKGDIEDTYWNDYKKFLIEQNNWTTGPEGTVSSLDRTSETILELCADPHLSSARRRGMVVGNVQSGKTASYIGLITKAADAGYKVIIVIAGMLEELRKQTQIRVEESFIGKDIASNINVGVGAFSERPSKKDPLCDTSRVSDFKKSKTENSDNLSNSTGTAPYIMVVKKNASTLTNLNLWLDGMRINNENHIVDLPMILIDDEADNASIDLRSRIKGKKKNKPSKDKDDRLFPEEDPSNYDATRINACIRTILQKFRVSTYVGYTATPFANILISPKTKNEILREDLFPNDFLYYLEPASGYFGPVEAFIKERNTKFFKEIDSTEISTSGEGILVPHKKDFRLSKMPDSLGDCIKSFIIATSIRWLQGEENSHSSMLVNASSYTDTQVSIANVIRSYVVDLSYALKASTGLKDFDAEKSTSYKSLKEFYDDEYKNNDFEWHDIKKIIHKVVSEIYVVHVNRLKTSERLNYDQYSDGRLVIAVGGFSLSRGLTLEGLVASYYLRTSKMYDTILQMGRWFGYREEYENLCRLYITKKAWNDFKFIAGVVNNLNRQIVIMQSDKKNTPRDFALFIQNHQDTKRLIATARLKMGAAEKVTIKDTFGARYFQNFYLERDLIKIKQNRNIVNGFLRDIFENYLGNRINEEVNPKLKDKFAFKDIQVKKILKIIEEFNFKFIGTNYDKNHLIEYIQKRSNQELSNWEVIIDSKNIGKSDGLDIGGFKITPTNRKATYDANADQDQYLETTQRIKSSIVSPKTHYLTTSDAILKKYKKKAKEDGTTLFKYFLEKNRVPKLIITILKLELFFDDDKKIIDSEIKNYLDKLPELYTLSYVFPVSSIKEKSREVLVNKDINNPYSRIEYVELDEDDGDD